VWRRPPRESSIQAFPALERLPAVQACTLRERLRPHLPPCLPRPKICAGWGKHFFREEKMQDKQLLTTEAKRLSGPKPTFKPYGVPRYRLTLVAESSGLEPSGPIQTSVVAASVLRPCFAGLDESSSSSADSMRNIASLASILSLFGSSLSRWQSCILGKSLSP
jgi:hypothetical protein